MTGPTGGRRRAQRERGPERDGTVEEAGDSAVDDGVGTAGDVPDAPDAESDAQAEAERGTSGPRKSLRRRAGEDRFDFLYRGNGGLDIIGRSRTWYLWSVGLVLACVLFMVLQGFNFGIAFQGGTSVQFPATGANGPISTEQAEQAYADALGTDPTAVQVVGVGPASTVQIRSQQLTQGEVVALREAVTTDLQPLNAAGQVDPAVVSDSAVSASWGDEITRQAIIALAVFLVLVTVYLTFYFDFRMAIASLLTLLFDLVVTAGIYSVVGFEVTPATVIGLLTVLGFSLYDTVIVFDKVRENTRGLVGLTRRTFAEAANLAVNQTLIRSFNTSLTSALPLIALLAIGVGWLGVGVLGELALVQLVGTLVGIASSVIVATPLVVTLAMRDPKWIEQARKVEARRAKDRARRAGTAVDDGPRLPGEPATVGASAAATGPVTSGAGAGPRASRGGAPSAPRPGARPAGKTTRRRR